MALALLSACDVEPVDRFCDAVRRASEQDGWQQADDREQRVASAWRGDEVTDPLAQIAEFDGLRAWHRAGALDELAQPGTRREERCAAARAWLAEESWSRHGYVVAVEGELLVVVGRDGSPDEPGGWPPPDEELERGWLRGLQEVSERPVGQAGGRATLHLPDLDDLSWRRAEALVATLVRAGSAPPDVYFTDRDTPLRLLPPPRRPGRPGPIERVAPAALEVELRSDGGRVEARARVLVDGFRPGQARWEAPPPRRALDVLEDRVSRPDPWARAWEAAAVAVPLASEEGCVLAWAGPPDRHASLPDRLATALEPFQPAGLAGLVRAEPGLPASRVMEAMVAMQGVGLEPVYATRIEEAEAECEGGVSGREELVARLEEVLRAAAAAEP